MASSLSPNLRIGFVTDVEGHWDHFIRYVSRSSVLFFDENHQLSLGEGCGFVHGGDLFDRGPGDIRLSRALCSLKRRFPDRVGLLLGNRDINKMRLTAELSLDVPPEKAFSAFWDPKALTLAQYLSRKQLSDTVTNRLKWALECTLGCPKTFEYRREELKLLLRKDNVSDDEVTQHFLDSVHGEDGIYRDYLSLGVLALRVNETLYVHGAADNRGLRFVPDTHLQFVQNAEEVVTGNYYDNIDEWIEKLNEFKDESLRQWIAAPSWRPDGTRGGACLVAYQCKPAIANKTICVHSYVDGLNISSVEASQDAPQVDGIQREARSNPFCMDSRAYLLQNGVRRIIVGHTPSGEAAAILQDQESMFHLISADTNYVTSGGDRAGAVVEIVRECDGTCRIHGVLADGVQEYDFILEKEPIVGTQTADGWWCKARMKDGSLLLGKGKGRRGDHIIRKTD